MTSLTCYVGYSLRIACCETHNFVVVISVASGDLCKLDLSVCRSTVLVLFLSNRRQNGQAGRSGRRVSSLERLEQPDNMLMKYREFNEIVNMSADELKDWLQGDESSESGWSKDDGSGETVGHER